MCSLHRIIRFGKNISVIKRASFRNVILCKYSADFLHASWDRYVVASRRLCYLRVEVERLLHEDGALEATFAGAGGAQVLARLFPRGDAHSAGTETDAAVSARRQTH